MVSWNLENFGKSKSDAALSFIANTLKDYEIIAIQEVVAGNGGAQAVAKLADELNRKGGKWEYIISEPTSSSAYKTERYAFLWKSSKIKIVGKPWLEKKYHLEIDREPFYATFENNKKRFTLANFHAITKERQPETEIKYFKLLPLQYPDLNLIFLGDFNCPQSHSVFKPLRNMQYESVFFNQKTSLRKNVHFNDYLASEFDNIWYDKRKIKILNAKVVLFFKSFPSFAEARKISDHIPIEMEFIIN